MEVVDCKHKWDGPIIERKKGYSYTLSCSLCGFPADFIPDTYISVDPEFLPKRKFPNRKRKSPYNRRRNVVFERDGWKCLNCEITTDLTLDHIIPQSEGGSNAINNLQTLCGVCNMLKANSTIDFRDRPRVAPIERKRGSLANLKHRRRLILKTSHWYHQRLIPTHGLSCPVVSRPSHRLLTP